MEIALDAFYETLEMMPFLFVVYVFIELVERQTSLMESRSFLQGKAAPLVGAATGVIPQCGFSVMAGNLYEKELIGTGTLLAVFISTSDEALVLLLSNADTILSGVILIAVKFVFAAIVGYVAWAFLRKREKLSEPVPQRKMLSRERENIISEYILHPLWHTVKIAFYFFAVTLAFGIIIELIGGESALASAFLGGPFVQPLITALVGLIPTCASSVVITGAYMSGTIAFGSLVAGLCCNAGLGVMVILRDTKKTGRNVAILVSMYVLSVAAGMAVNGVMAGLGML